MSWKTDGTNQSLQHTLSGRKAQIQVSDPLQADFPYLTVLPGASPEQYSVLVGSHISGRSKSIGMPVCINSLATCPFHCLFPPFSNQKRVEEGLKRGVKVERLNFWCLEQLRENEEGLQYGDEMCPLNKRRLFRSPFHCVQAAQCSRAKDFIIACLSSLIWKNKYNNAFSTGL